MFLITAGLANRTEKVDILSATISDHSLIQLTIAMDDFTKRPGIWRLKAKLLRNAELCTKITDTLGKLTEDFKHLSPN